VRHEDRAGEEVEQPVDDPFDARGVDDHGVGDPGDGGDGRRYRQARVDERAQLADHLAAADLDGSDLGDAVVGGREPRRLQVEDHEGHLEQWRAERVETELLRLARTRADTGGRARGRRGHQGTDRGEQAFGSRSTMRA
jgi:hypothetical protein